MRQQPLWFSLAAGTLVAVAIGVWLRGIPRSSQWTTSSAAARAELERAHDAEMRLYEEDAIVHLERALQHDPELTIAKVQLAELLVSREPSHATHLFEQVAAADVDRLTARERLLVQRAVAMRSGRFKEAAELVERYLAANPDDPFALRIMAEDRWSMAELETAEQLYQRLLEISPNWVVAYNNLGYLAMAQGQFAKAEEYFTSYRFIAPDQANPHDSVGELYVIVGRYEEAADSFERALTIKPDFCLSLQHLLLARLLQESFDQAQATVDRAVAAGCAAHEVSNMVCTGDYLGLMMSRSWQEILARDSAECLLNAAGIVTVVIHRAACETGNRHRAASLETALGRALAHQRGPATIVSERLGPNLIHMQAVRLTLEGRLQRAVRRFEQADQVFAFSDCGPGVLKLWNLLMLAQVHDALGQGKEAERLVARVRAINPRLVATFKHIALDLRHQGSGT